MLPSTSSLCSPTSSYLINYEIQFKFFKWVDQKTEKTKWIRFPVACAFGVSNLVTLITRIMSVIETFFIGSKLLLSSPFSENKMEKAKLGLNKISIQTPKNILRLFFILIEAYVNGIFGVLMNPKFYIISHTETMKVNLIHARKGTIQSIEHDEDLYEADGIANQRLLSYQEVLH